jgi:hypothetical protein
MELNVVKERGSGQNFGGLGKPCFPLPGIMPYTLSRSTALAKGMLISQTIVRSKTRADECHGYDNCEGDRLERRVFSPTGYYLW